MKNLRIIFRATNTARGSSPPWRRWAGQRRADWQLERVNVPLCFTGCAEEDGNVMIDRYFFTVGFEPTKRILHLCTKIICKVFFAQFISLQSEVDIVNKGNVRLLCPV